MFRLASLFALVVLCGSNVVAFAPVTTTTTSPPTTTVQSSSSLLRMSDEIGEGASPLEAVPLAFKFLAVLTIKTVKDAVTYPPLLLEQALYDYQQQQQQQQSIVTTPTKDELPTMSPLVMLAKLIGVLMFKMVRDAVYYPTVWTERMIQCQSLDECEL